MRTQSLVITQGIPCSGKSTYARQWQEQSPQDRIIAERDQIRKTLFGIRKCDKLSRNQEKEVTAYQEKLIRGHLADAYSVIVSDTNLHPGSIHRFRKMADEYDVEFEVVDFTDVPFDVCVERNAQRSEDERIPAGAMVRMHKRIMKKKKNYKVEKRPLNVHPDKQNCIISDLDGTLFYMTGRSPYDSIKAISDMPNAPTMMVVKAMVETFGCTFIAVSGREDKAYKNTFDALVEYEIKPDYLFMRKTGDSRRDSIIKEEIYREFIEPYFNVIFVLDDRTQVIKETWRSLGLQCFQVAEGDF